MTGSDFHKARRSHRAMQKRRPQGAPAAGGITTPTIQGAAITQTPSTPPATPTTPSAPTTPNNPPGSFSEPANTPPPDPAQNTQVVNTPSSPATVNNPATSAAVSSNTAVSVAQPATVITPTTKSVASVVPVTPASVVAVTTPQTAPGTVPTALTVSHPLVSGTVAGIASSSATSSAVPTSALSTGSIVGIAAGGLVLFGLLISASLWLMKRYFRRRDERNGWNRESYLRNSVHVADEDEPAYFNKPRPPTMIEKHFGAAGVGAHGVTTNPSFNPGELATPNPFLTPMASPHASAQGVMPGVGVAGYDQHQQQPYVTRSNSMGSGGHGQAQAYEQDPAYDHQQQYQAQEYAHLERGYQAQEQAPSRARVTSPQPTSMNVGPHSFPVPQQNYSHPTSASPPAQLVTVPENMYAVAGNETPVQYGFLEGETTRKLGVTNHAQGHGRPETIYDEEDAYGGI